MPGAAGQLKALWQQLIGGTAPAGAASASGDISQMMKYLIANPASPTFRKNRATPPSGTTGGLVYNPLLIATVGRASWAVQGFSTPSETGTPIYTWDSVNKTFYVGNTTGIDWNQRFIPGEVPFPGGLPANGGNPGAQGFDLDGGTVGLLPDFAKKILTAEWYGALPNIAARSDNCGVGWGGNVANSFISNYRNVQAWADSTNGWSISTADGAVQSTTAEASKTCDANQHLFRLEWEETAVRLYVDGVLKVTKTTNIPNGSTTTSSPHAVFALAAPSTAASNAIKTTAIVVYYK